MKRKLFILFLLVSLEKNAAYSQENVMRYVQLTATIDILGNIYVTPIVFSKKETQDLDSAYLNEVKILNKIIGDKRKPVFICNEFAKHKWHLISVVHISKDDQGRPNTPFLLYYFGKKE
jgi:hypothetical protein